MEHELTAREAQVITNLVQRAPLQNLQEADDVKAILVKFVNWYNELDAKKKAEAAKP
jgi:hypothetical protein